MHRSVLPAIVVAFAPLAISQTTIHYKVTPPQSGNKGDARQAMSRVESPLAFGRGHLVIQFDEAPTAALLAELKARGATVLSDMPDNAVLVSLGQTLDLTGLRAQYAEPLQPGVKISPLIGPESGDDLVVEFHPDVDMNVARGIVLGLGLELHENPDVGAKRLLVRRRMRARAADPVAPLAARDEVAYIFPASNDLVKGLRVIPCVSGLTENGVLGQYIATVGEGWDGAGLGSAALTYVWGNPTAKLPAGLAQSEIIRAMNEWSRIAAISWSEGSNATGLNTVKVLFGAGSHGDAYPFDGPGNVLAHTFYPAPPNPEPIAGDLHLDEDESWRVGADTDLYSVVLHELGHALGLGHSDDPTAVMYPYYRISSALQADDKSAILTLYAAPVPSTGGGHVSADSVTPGYGSGASQVFTFVFSDTTAASNVQAAAMLINNTLSGTNACWLVFDRARASISLLYDNPAGSNSKPFGSTANVQNSQCALGAPSMTVSGTSTILSIPLSFYGAFTGPKNIYMYAMGPNGNTGWVHRGTYSVVAGGVPVASSVSPASGAGLAQTFSFVMSDQGGANFIWAAAMLFSRSSNFDLNNGCYVVWDRTANSLALFGNTYTNGASGFAIGSSGSVSNSQCTLLASGSTVTFGSTTVTITLNLTFSTSFSGAKNTFLYASEPGYNSGWRQVGSWSVPGVPPAVNLITPSSGSGLNQNFTVSTTTVTAPSDLTGMSLLVTPSGTQNACYVTYNRAAGTIALYDDGASTLNSKSIGSSAALQNSQCAIGYSVVNIVGGTASLTVQIVFKSPLFVGTKQVYVEGSNPSGSSNLVLRGSWVIP